MRPEGWNRIEEDTRRGGLVYFYPDGSDYHMTKDELRASIWPEVKDEPAPAGQPDQAPS